MKLYILLAAILVLSFFSNDFGLVDIQKTAVILAAGVDRSEQGFRLTAQIAVPKGSDRTTGGTSSVEIEAEGATVSDCISRIYSETGWVPKLVFCDLVVIGEETAKEGVMAGLDFFLRNEYMPDSCLVAVCESTAQELISSASAIDDASALAVENLFSAAAEKSGKVVKNTLREFAVDYYGASHSGYMPYIRMYEQESAEGSGSDGGSGAEQTQKTVIYSAEETALFSDGRMVALLPREQTFAFSLVLGKVFAGTFTAEEDGNPVDLSILKNKGGASLRINPSPKAEISVSVTVRLYNRGVPAPVNDVADQTVSSELLGSAEDILSGYLKDLVETCRASGCDLFRFRRSLYRSSLSAYAEWKDAVPGAVETSVTAKVKSVK